MKKTAVVAIALWVLLAAAGTCLAEANTYDHKVEIDKMTFEWRIDGQRLHVRVSAPTTGWVAVGFNPSAAMQDANFVMGYVKDGKVTVEDHFGSASFQHDKDTKLGGTDDVADIAGQEAGGTTTIGFSLPLNSGDGKDQAIQIDGETKVLLAYGAGRDSFRARHKFRATLAVQLQNGQFKRLK